nr:hypothetical protein [Tanacetum cinerariifolium]
MYKFKGYIIDNTATALITFFTPAANKVTDYSCVELLEKYKPADPTKIPPEILEAQGKYGVFQFHFNTLGNLTDLSLDAVYDVEKQDHITSSGTQEINKVYIPTASEDMMPLLSQRDATAEEVCATDEY